MTKKIQNLLVANRGEISLRVMRSAKEIGIRTGAGAQAHDAAARAKTKPRFIETTRYPRRVSKAVVCETFINSLKRD